MKYVLMIFLQKRNSINIRIADNMNPVIGLPLLLPSHITLKIATENNIVAKARISLIMKLCFFILLIKRSFFT